MNSIKIDYDYRFLDFSDDKNKSLCMICFKGVYLNDIHPVYKINLGELIVLEIKKN